MDAVALQFTLEGFSDLVSANAAKETAFAWGNILEHMISAANGVERGTSWDGQLVRMRPELSEQRLVRGISEACLAVLQVVLLKNFVILELERDVEKRVFDGDQEQVLAVHLLLF